VALHLGELSVSFFLLSPFSFPFLYCLDFNLIIIYYFCLVSSQHESGELPEEKGVWWKPALADPIIRHGKNLVLIHDDHMPKNEALFQKLASLLPLLDGSIGNVKKAYWIDNSMLVNMFEGALECMAARHQLNPSEFKKDRKNSLTDAQLKEEYIKKLENQIKEAARFLEFNSQVSIVPVVHGTSENAAHRIAKNGFGTVATLDPGWYGQGIYVTSKVSYASIYAQETPDGKVFMVSIAIPGNVFPISEPPFTPKGEDNPHGFLGKPCQPGYQSHYTVVTEEGERCGYPLQGTPSVTSWDELVVFEPSQLLPIFVFYMK
jgi:hypothetical protein